GDPRLRRGWGRHRRLLGPRERGHRDLARGRGRERPRALGDRRCQRRRPPPGQPRRRAARDDRRGRGVHAGQRGDRPVRLRREGGRAASDLSDIVAVMANYLLLFLGRAAADPDATDDETVDYNARWREYMGGLAQAGQLRSGAPLVASGRLVAADAVTDLELAEVDIGGFMVVEAESLGAAEAIAERAPHIELGGSTIVRECLTVG